MRWLVLSLWIIGLVLFGLGLDPAWAIVRSLEEQPGTMLYQSRDSLQDDQGTTWQVVLFKRVSDHQPPILNLRLVGFPEKTVFEHPAPLILHSPQGETALAEDVLVTENPGPNVGQYNMQLSLEKLSDSSFWELELPLTTPQPTTLKIPYFLIQEWRMVSTR